MRLFVIALPLLFASRGFAEPDTIPDPQLDVVFNYCIECHDDLTAKGDLNLDIEEIDWSDKEALKHWSDVYTRLDRGMMPPADKPQPTAAEKALLLTWIDEQLMEHSPIGGAPMRRLNRREYHNTLTELFPIPNLELPPGFPADNTSHGFDTVSKALVISPSHLEAYRDTATMVADYLFPQPRVLPESRKFTYGLDGFAISYSSAYVVEGAMRIASAGSLNRNGTWLSRFEAPESGIYQLTVDLSSKHPPAGDSPNLLVQATNPEGKNPRRLTTFEITNPKAKTFHTKVELHRGETVAFSYLNSPLDFEDKKAFPVFLNALFKNDPELAAAWDAVDEGSRGVPRGGTGWEKVKEAMKQAPGTGLSPKEIEELAKMVSRNNVSTGETIVFKYFEEGPNIGIHGASIEGPFSLVEDNLTRARENAKKRFLGDSFENSEAGLKTFFHHYLSNAFRRPATEEEAESYVRIVQREMENGRPLEEGLHLAIRTSLLSSHFLYKERGSTPELKSYELAARLAYFLTSSPPDQRLLDIAAEGNLWKKKSLQAQSRRLIKEHNRTFASDFTSLWLDTHLLDTIMPDVKLLANYNEHYRNSISEETVKTFQEILTKNQPLQQFIDPDFLFTNPTIGWEIYELARFEPEKKARPKRGKLANLERVSIPKGTRHGGLLGMPAVMMATANGVDTQPVLRGVWMLENIIGRPPPEAPDSVSALSPDLSGAKTLKERLSAHMADQSCASCHVDIDPVGFVLENFDAVGKWRTEYPANNPKEKGLAVDSTGILPEGTPLNDVTDLKKWLIENPEHFARCLAEKLMIYGTGRVLNYREKQIVDEIADANLANGNRFEDLIIELVQSEVFLRR